MNLTWRKIIEIIISISLAVAILYWLYKDFPFDSATHSLVYDIHWGWMLLSLLFGILPQILRAMRWKMALAPLQEHPSLAHCSYSIFMSFAVSLVIPRIGEISRCATLKKTDGTSFATAVGTVVTERIIDSLLVLLIVGTTFIIELPTFVRFLTSAGFNSETFFANFSVTGIVISVVCTALIVGITIILLRRLTGSSKIKEVTQRFTNGISSIRNVSSISLYAVYSIAIWFCYFLHFYLAFFAFQFTSSLSFHAGLLAFCMITVAVLVPTPNGAGPWHFAVKVILLQFGVAVSDAILFALIVHALQTLLVILLGFYGYAALKFESFNNPAKTNIISK